MSNGVKTTIDTFNDNTLNSTTWGYPQGTAYITEVSGRLKIVPDGSYPYQITKAKWDLTSCIFGVKWYAGSGTATPSTTFILTADDASSNQLILATTPQNNVYQFQGAGATTVSGSGVNGTGVGTSLTDGTWIGIGNLGSDNVLHLYKSSDGVTWTSIGSCTVGGTFAKTKVAFRIQGGHYTSTETPTWVSNIDEAAIFAATPQPRIKVRVGGSWVYAVPKVRVGGAWVVARPRVRVGGAWTTAE